MPAVAQAQYESLGSFGSGQLNNPVGVSVDQSNGDVYVGDLQTDNYKFDSTGNVISPPSPFGGGSGLYSGTAVNPTNGDVYVVDAQNLTIDTNDPNTGAVLSTFPIPDAGNLFGAFAVVQIATNSAGDVYVPTAPDSDVVEYDSSGNVLHTFAGSGAQALSAPTGVAVDASGHVWVADAGNNRIEEFSSDGSTVLSSIASTGVQAVATDPAGDVFASVTDGSGSHVLEYDSTGNQIDDFGLGTIGTSGFGSLNAIDVNDQTGVVYVADGGNNVVWRFAPPLAPSVVEHVRDVTASSATLAAEIDPNNVDTTYHFEWGTSVCSSSACTKVPAPDADLGSGGTAQSVSQHLQGLQPATTYHFRVVAANSVGTTDGPDRTVTTPLASGSSGLPDNRGYELVTPVDKGYGALPTLDAGQFTNRPVQASVNGDAITYFAFTPFPGSPAGGGNQYLSTRTAIGWSTHSLVPPQATTQSELAYPNPNVFNPDLSQFVLADGGNAGLGQDDPPLVPGEPPNNPNIFLSDTSPLSNWQVLDPMPVSGAPSGAEFMGASQDLSRIFFVSGAQMTSTPVSSAPEIYQWESGQLSLVSMIPPAGDISCGGGGPTCVADPNGALVGTGDSIINAISMDGSQVIFSDEPGTNDSGNIYLRENGTKTIVISASQKTNGTGPGGTDPNGHKEAGYVTATPDGSHILFTSCEQLTNDATAHNTPGSLGAGCSPDSQDLYEYDTSTGTLTDLSVDTHGDPNAADVQGVVAMSSDASYIYFVANGVLAPGASLGNCQLQVGNSYANHCNLYLYHDGTVSFIANLSGADQNDWLQSRAGAETARVTTDGTRLAFPSYYSLTGYDNTPAAPGDCNTSFNQSHGGGQSIPTCREIYLYDASANQIVCASCNPSGAQPTGDAFVPGIEELIAESGDSSDRFAYLPRYLSADGSRLFFDTIDNLAPNDNNGQEDVYEYEDGHAYLMSGGTASSPSQFLDASRSGDDVFFQTEAALVPQDGAGTYDVYDARVGGGFASAPSPAPCSGDVCQGTPSGQPSVPSAATVTFFGPPNGTPGAVRARVKVLHKTVKGSKLTLTVRVPARGRIAVTGGDIRAARRSVVRVGVYKLSVTLTAMAKRALKHKRKLRLTLRITYTPSSGRASTASVSLTVRR